jgi:hypothetical protein
VAGLRVPCYPASGYGRVCRVWTGRCAVESAELIVLRYMRYLITASVPKYRVRSVQILCQNIRSCKDRTKLNGVGE